MPRAALGSTLGRGASRIGRAVAIAFAKEGADVAISYLCEHQDAEETRRLIEKEGRRCMTIAGDIGEENFCRRIVEDHGGSIRVDSGPEVGTRFTIRLGAGAA